MSQNVSSQNVNALFKAAGEAGDLSQKSLQALNVVDHGAQIQRGLGVDVGDVEASEVTLVTLVIDDSGSIRFVQGNTEAVREGHNGILGALDGSKQKDGILCHTRYLNHGVLYPYCALKDAVKMEAGNYNPDGGTPLYDQVIVTLGSVVAKTQDFEDNGVSVRSVTAIVTDGADTGSRASVAHVKALVDDMLKSEKHIICGMGIADGSTNFEQVFADMGIRKEWILTPTNDPKSIRKAFAVVSQSALRASQSAKRFSKAALGGFGG